MPLEFALLSLAIIVGFVIIGGLAILLQREWEGVPEPLRAWLLERTHGVKHIPARRRRVRKVDQFALCRISRVQRRHQRRFARVPNHRTAELDARTTPGNDITERGAYRPLTADQAAFAEKCFTANQWLPPAQRFSCNTLYAVFGGTRTRRIAELSAIKQAVDARVAAQHAAAQEARLATLIGEVPPRPEIEVPPYAPPVVSDA